MKRNTKRRIVASALCLIMLVQTLWIGAISTSAAGENSAFTYVQTFDESPLAQTKNPIFTPETPFEPGNDDGNNSWDKATAPEVQNDGSLLFDAYDGLMLYWQNIDGFSFAANKTYTITFDVNITENSDGTDIRGGGWNREFYFGMGCWFNQVEFRSRTHSDLGIRAGDANDSYPNGGWTRDGNFALGEYSVEVVWSPSAQTVTSTVKRGNDIIRQGQRIAPHYSSDTALSKIWGWRCEGGSYVLSNLTMSDGTNNYTADFTKDYAVSSESSPIWSVETVQKQAKAPDFVDGKMKMESEESVCFNWTNLAGVGEFDSSNTYSFEFDVTMTNAGNGSKWGGDEYHTRALYTGFGGWYNQVILMSKGDKIDAGDTNTVYSADTYLNKPLHVSVVWEGSIVYSTISDANGKTLLDGSRTNANYASLSDGHMKYFVLRCEDGAVEIDNFKFTKTHISSVGSTTINIPENSQAIYECDVEYDGVSKSALKYGSYELFSVAPGAFKICQKQIRGEFGTGTYKLKAYINPIQKMVSVEVIKPDGGVVRRAVYSFTGGTAIEIFGASATVVSNEKITYQAVTANEYELVNTEPTSTGFAANVYNLVTSFDDAYTTRNFAWTAQTSFIGDADMAVKYRAQGTSNWTMVSAVKEVDHTAKQLTTEKYFKCDISGLTPNTTYEYRIGIKNSNSTGDWSKIYTFTTADKDMDGFTFIAVGDTQGITWDGEEISQKGFKYAQAAFVEAFQEISNPAFILHTGDVVEHGNNEQMWNWYFKALGEYGATTPHFAAIGNHDARTDSLYFDLHFNHPNNGGTAAIDKSVTTGKIDSLSQYLVDNSDETIYSYNYGDAHFIVLNTGNYTADDQYIIKSQREWLKKDLEANKCAKWTIVTMHEPGYHRSINQAVENRPWFNDIFEDYGVDLVIQGHSHLVTRTYPMKDGKIVSKSITDTIPQGTGTIYTTIGSTALNKDGASDSVNIEEIFSMSVPEKAQATYTAVEINENGLSVVTKQLNGLVLDTFTITADKNQATSHAVEIKNAKEATCKEDGYTGDKICAGCGEVFETGTTIPATPDKHNTKTVGIKLESCGKDGYTGDKVCKDCDQTIQKGEVIPATGRHYFRAWTTTKEATTTEAGEKTSKCIICSHVATAEIPMLGADNNGAGNTNTDADNNTDADAGANTNDVNTDTNAATDSVTSDTGDTQTSGCGSSLGAASVVAVMVTVIGTAVIRKKED